MNTFTEDYRDNFIEFISDLSKDYASFKWWCSTVSEKNVFTENNLYKLLNDLVFRNKKPEELLAKQFSFKKIYKSRRRFIAEKLLKIQKLPKLDFTKKYIGLLTWIDARNFDNNGNFKETYFNLLFEELRNRDDFLLLIFPLYTLGEKKAYNLLKQLNINFLDIFKFYKKIDILKALLFSLYYQPLKKSAVFRDFDITQILESYFLRESYENHYANYYLMYYSIMRLAQAGLKFDRIIYPFENQPWEKILCYAVRQFMPQTTLIGYMHTMSLPNLVRMFPGRYESKNMPQPDFIFTTGKLTADELKKFWPPEKIVENCALRYQYLFSENFKKTTEIQPQQTRMQQKQNLKTNILLALSGDYKKSLEMIRIVYNAFRDTNDFNIIIKPHPTYNLNVYDLQTYGININYKNNLQKQNSSNFEITIKPVAELLPDCSIVITAESTVGLEGIKVGCVMIELETQDFIPLSRLEYANEIKIIVKTADDLLEKTKEILNWSTTQKNEYLQKANKFINYCFNKPEKKYLKQFIEYSNKN